MAQDVLREFLVKLTYGIDAQSERRFATSVATATKGALALGAALGSAAVAVVGAVAKINQSFEQLYYMSQRTATSVQSIRSFSYAVGQLGGSYESAKGSIEAVGKALRSNPGYSAMIRDLGVATSKNGQLRETTEIMKDLGKTFQKMPYYVGLQYAGALGIDESTFRSLRDGGDEIERYQRRYSEVVRRLGVDNERAAAQGKDFMNAWRDLTIIFQAVGDKIAQSLTPRLTEMLKLVGEWLIDNMDRIERAFNYVLAGLEGFIRVCVKVVEAVKPIIAEFDAWAKSMTGENGLTIAMTVLAAVMIAKMTGLGAALTGIAMRNPILAALFFGTLGMKQLLFGSGDSEAMGSGPQSNPTSPGGGGGIGGWWNRNAPPWLGGSWGTGGGGGGGGGGGSVVGGGQGMRARAGRAGRGDQPAIPDNIPMTPEERNTLGLILKHESGGKNVMNYVGRSQGLDPMTPRGYTAQGYYQMLNSNWRRIAPGLGIKAPNAMSASFEDQTRVALHLLRNGGVKNWANFNPGLRAALARGDRAPTGSVPALAGTGAPGAPGAAAPGATDNSRIPGATGGGAAGRPLFTPEELRQGKGVKSTDFPDDWVEGAVSGGRKITPMGRAFGDDKGGLSVSAPLGIGVSGGNGDFSKSIELNQKTEINIMGGSSPAETAAAVADQQGRVGNSALRNAQGAIR